MRGLALVTAALAAALLSACGGGAGDLLAMEVSGGPTGAARQTLVVTEDGHARCNGGQRRKIESDLLIDAREVEREGRELAGKGTDLQTSRAGARQYVLRVKDGTVRFTEGESLPPELAKAALFALRLGRVVCAPA